MCREQNTLEHGFIISQRGPNKSSEKDQRETLPFMKGSGRGEEWSG